MGARGLLGNVCCLNIRLRPLSLMEKLQFLHRSADRGGLPLMPSCSDVLGSIGLLNVLIHSIHDLAGRIVSTLIRKLYFPYQCSGFDVIS